MADLLAEVIPEFVIYAYICAAGFLVLMSIAYFFVWLIGKNGGRDE